jgi:hypothetical protein
MQLDITDLKREGRGRKKEKRINFTFFKLHVVIDINSLLLINYIIKIRNQPI